MRDIKIEMVTNGYIVHVGCKRFVYHETKAEELLSDVGHYMADPVAYEKRFLASCANDAKLKAHVNALCLEAPQLRNTTRPPVDGVGVAGVPLQEAI